MNNTVTSQTFELTNVGTEKLTCSELIGFDQGFATTLVPGDINLSAGDSYSFTISFNPAEAGEVTKTAIIRTNGGDLPIRLFGHGTDCQTIVPGEFYEESFEQNILFSLPPCWESKKATDVGTGWITAKSGTPFQVDYTVIFTSTPGGGGEQVALCNSEDASFLGMPYGDAVSDQWLVSPQFSISTNDTLSFYLQYYGPQTDLLEVKVSETDTNLSSFQTMATISSTELIPNEWKRYKFSLSDYASKNIFIAIRENIANTLENSGLFALDRFAVFSKDYTSVDNISLQNDLKIFPSPATDFIQIQLSENIKQVEIIAVSGKVVKSIKKTASNSVRADIQDLPAGVYFVRVKTADSVVTRKIVVK